jgi:hypothetical protein
MNYNHRKRDSIENIQIEETSNNVQSEEPVEGLYCTIKPDEIPPIPAHKFLSRQTDSTNKSQNENNLSPEKEKQLDERETR